MCEAGTPTGDFRTCDDILSHVREQLYAEDDPRLSKRENSSDKSTTSSIFSESMVFTRLY